MSLFCIPEEIFLYISTLLAIDDVISLSQTCKYLRNILPRHCIDKCIHVIQGPDINISGIFSIVHDRISSSWKQSTYFDVQPFTSHLYDVAISMYWKDDGRANRKAQIYLQLWKPNIEDGTSEMVIEDRNIFSPATNLKETVYTILTRKKSVISMARPGDYLRFMKSYDWWDGNFTVNNFQLIIRRLFQVPKIGNPGLKMIKQNCVCTVRDCPWDMDKILNNTKYLKKSNLNYW